MKLREALAAGICRVREPQWAYKTSYMQFDVWKEKDGTFIHGPWAHLWAREEQEVQRNVIPAKAHEFPTPQTVGIWHLDHESEIEIYEGQIDPEDKWVVAERTF